MARSISNRLIQRVRRHQNMTTIFRSIERGQPQSTGVASMRGQLGGRIDVPQRLVIGQIVAPAEVHSVEVHSVEAPATSEPATVENVQMQREFNASIAAQTLNPELQSAASQSGVELETSSIGMEAELSASPVRPSIQQESQVAPAQSSSDVVVARMIDETNAGMTLPKVQLPSQPLPAQSSSQQTSNMPAITELASEIAPASSPVEVPENSAIEEPEAEQPEDERRWSRLQAIRRAHERREGGEDLPIQRSEVTQQSTAHSIKAESSEQISSPIDQKEQHQPPQADRLETEPSRPEIDDPAPSIIQKSDSPQPTQSDGGGLIADSPRAEGSADVGVEPSPSEVDSTQSTPNELIFDDLSDESIIPTVDSATDSGTERPSLDQVWPVQRQQEAEITTSINEQDSLGREIPVDNKSREVSNTIQSMLENVAPAQDTASSVHIIAPRRSRPSHLRANTALDSASNPAQPPQASTAADASTVQTQLDDSYPADIELEIESKNAPEGDLAEPEVESPSLRSEPLLQTEQSTPPSVQAQDAFDQIPIVETEIGALPSDLWPLINEPIPDEAKAVAEQPSTEQTEAKQPSEKSPQEMGSNISTSDASIVQPSVSSVASEQAQNVQKSTDENFQPSLIMENVGNDIPDPALNTAPQLPLEQQAASQNQPVPPSASPAPQDVQRSLSYEHQDTPEQGLGTSSEPVAETPNAMATDSLSEAPSEDSPGQERGVSRDDDADVTPQGETSAAEASVGEKGHENIDVTQIVQQATSEETAPASTSFLVDKAPADDLSTNVADSATIDDGTRSASSIQSPTLPSTLLSTLTSSNQGYPNGDGHIQRSSSEDSDGRKPNQDKGVPLQQHSIDIATALMRQTESADEEMSDAELDSGAEDLELGEETPTSDEDDSSDSQTDEDENEDDEEEISELARQVYAHLQRKLVVERERMR